MLCCFSRIRVFVVNSFTRILAVAAVAEAVVLSATQKLRWIFQLLTLVDLNSADSKDSVELVCNSFSFLIRSFSHGFSVFGKK